MDINELYTLVLDCAFRVHRELGPGLLESIYKKCLVYELRKNGFQIDVEMIIPIIYDGVDMESIYKADIVVEGMLIIELKAVKRIEDIHIAQTMTYMKLTGINRGLILNFNTPRLKDGIRRVIM